MRRDFLLVDNSNTNTILRRFQDSAVIGQIFALAEGTSLWHTPSGWTHKLKTIQFGLYRK